MSHFATHTTDAARTLRQLASARTSRNQLGLHAGVLCSGCRGSASAPCVVCRKQRDQVAAMAAGGRSLRGIAASTGLPVQRVSAVLEQTAAVAELQQNVRDTRQAAFRTETAADSEPLSNIARKKLLSGDAVSPAALRSVIDPALAAQQLTLSEIAARCGYGDYSQFARLLGYVPVSGKRVKGHFYGGKKTRAIARDTAAAICLALDINPREVPGL